MKIEIPEKKKLVYEMIIPIRWGDMDALGHLNNASYFRFFETTRIDWLQSIGGMSYAGGEGFVIVNAFCSFLRQLQYPGDVLSHDGAHRSARRNFRQRRIDGDVGGHSCRESENAA